jgi:hypothetical protein
MDDRCGLFHRQPDDFTKRSSFFHEHFHIEYFSAQAEESGGRLAFLRRTISRVTTLVGAAD